MSLVFLSEVDSTNSWLIRNAATLKDADAVYTDNQTAGRGRKGRVWENQPGAMLCLSMLIRRPLADPTTLPLLSSLAAADAVEQLCGCRGEIKWPNDLLLQGKKICGILCESLLSGADACYIPGIGINLAQPADFFAARGLPHGGSLLSLTGVSCDLKTAAEALYDALLRRLDAFAAGGFPAIAAEYRAACVNLGKEVYTDTLRGTAVAVDDAGRLVVRTAEGETAVFTGEVTVRGIY
ncbi:MAG TPA: biotin--[acetyl-CoA-carboxylase] ligase [Candidatus Pygmaiobacter gallistercoris]|nr:biotin--[acetyl-CoA-carboxylase] ligase [Candidatus Pygmaiobacter gallistercoris]